MSEAQHFGGGGSRVLPCQALDHSSGYLLATGIAAGLYKRATEGGSYEVNVSLAGTMNYLRGLGQYEGKSGFDCKNYMSREDVPDDFMETKGTPLGELRAVKHSATVEGVNIGWDVMPKSLGSDEAAWT